MIVRICPWCGTHIEPDDDFGTVVVQFATHRSDTLAVDYNDTPEHCGMGTDHDDLCVTCAVSARDSINQLATHIKLRSKP
jgi:hypothetical protein